MKNKLSIGILLLLVFHLAFAKTSEKPNFVFVLTDDHRYDVLGCTGNDIVKSPNIDKLAKDGVLFTNAHVTSAICTPSRVSMLLSQYERKHGVNFNSGTSVNEYAWSKSYPMVMRENGYYTGYIGKNHSPIGHNGYDSGLMEKSFDYWYAGHEHLGFYPKKRHPIFKHAKKDTQVEILTEGMDDFLSNEHRLEGALHFIDERPQEQAFCLSINFNLPHNAGIKSMKLLPSDSVIYRDLYRDVDFPLPENYIARKDIKTPKLPAEIHFANERQTGYDYVDNVEDLKENMIRYHQAVTGIDGLVGELLRKLKEEGLDKNTIIIFSSDHGIFWGEYGLGGKSLCYEINTHIPMIVYNPMGKKKNAKPNNALVQSIDIAATMLDYAGIDIPEEFQGKSMKGLVEGETTAHRDYLYTENLWSTHFGNPRCEAVQNQEWKYIRYYANHNQLASDEIALAKEMGINVNRMLYGVHDPQMVTYRNYVEAPFNGEKPVYEELYHLSDDPAEMNNLATDPQYADVLKKLRKAWKTEVTAARGEGKAQVLRYTVDSKALVKPE